MLSCIVFLLFIVDFVHEYNTVCVRITIFFVLFDYIIVIAALGRRAAAMTLGLLWFTGLGMHCSTHKIGLCSASFTDLQCIAVTRDLHALLRHCFGSWGGSKGFRCFVGPRRTLQLHPCTQGDLTWRGPFCSSRVDPY